MIKALYLIVTNDKYEIPLFLADNIKELSEISGKSSETLIRNFNRSRQRKFRTGIYKQVFVNFTEKEWKDLNKWKLIARV